MAYNLYIIEVDNDTYETNISCYQHCLFGSITVGHKWGNFCYEIVAQADPIGKEYFWISGVFLVLLGIIGFLGNIFTIVVLCQPKMRKRVFYNLLLALACFDTLFILTYGTSYAYMSLAGLECPNYKEQVYYLFYPAREICLVGSIYMTVAISLERYLGICHPQLQFSRGALVYILPVVIIDFAFTFPTFMEIEYSFENGTLETRFKDMRYEHQYEQAYNLWAEVIFKTIIPLISLFFLNGSIIVTIKQTTHPLRTQAGREGNSTMILFCIVFVFLTFHVPRVVHKLFYYLDHENESSWHLIYPIFRLALTTNSAINFLIYSMVGREFRAEFIKLFKYKKALTSKTSSNGKVEISSLEITSL